MSACIQVFNAATHKRPNFTSLTIRRSKSDPSKSNVTAAEEGVQSLERNVWLRALTRHERSSGVEGWAGDVLWRLSTFVHDDVDRRRPIDEVFGKGIVCQLGSVVLDERLYDSHNLTGILLGHAYWCSSCKNVVTSLKR